MTRCHIRGKNPSAGFTAALGAARTFNVVNCRVNECDKTEYVKMSFSPFQDHTSFMTNSQSVSLIFLNLMSQLSGVMDLETFVPPLVLNTCEALVSAEHHFTFNSSF